MHYSYRKEQSISLARLPALPSWAIPEIWGVEVIMSQWSFICWSCQHNLPVIVTHIQHLCTDTDRGNCDGSQNGKSQHVLCLNTAIQMKEQVQIPWIGINSPVILTYIVMSRFWLQSLAQIYSRLTTNHGKKSCIERNSNLGSVGRKQNVCRYTNSRPREPCLRSI